MCPSAAASPARPRSAVISEWHRAVAGQLAVGVPATLALLGLAGLVLRGQAALTATNAGLELRVADRTAALADRERLLGQALEAGRVFALEFEPAADLVLRSPNAAAILGLPEAAAIRDTGNAFLASVHPEDRRRLLAALSAMSPDRPAYEARFRYTRPDGRVVWLQDDGAAEFEPDGQIRTAAQLAAQHSLAGGVNPVHLEETLGDVEADGDDDGLSASLHGGRLLSLDAFNSSDLGTRCRVGAVHPITSLLLDEKPKSSTQTQLYADLQIVLSCVVVQAKANLRGRSRA